MLDFPLMLLVKLPVVVVRIHSLSNRLFTSVDNKGTVDSKCNDSPGEKLGL